MDRDEEFTRAEKLVDDARIKKGALLNLSISGLSRIPSLADLDAVEELRLRFTHVRDISPIADLKNLKTLDLSFSPISNIEPLRHLKSLTTLSLELTQPSDLAALEDLTLLENLRLGYTRIRSVQSLSSLRRLRSLELRNTEITDLKPLSYLSRLETLNLATTPVRDLSPLSTLIRLKQLDLTRSRVSDIRPLAGLSSLQSLALSSSLVSDLSPLAELTSLIEGAKQPGRGGIAFGGCPISNKTVQGFARLEKLRRTRRTIDYLREEQGLDPFVDEEPDIRASQLELDIIPPPPVPKRSAGPHLTVRHTDGVIDFAPPEAMDHSGNNLPRLTSLFPLLSQAAQELVAELDQGNAPHSSILNVAEAYLSEVSRGLSGIDFAKLCGLGIRLENASSAARRQIADRDLPELTDNAQEKLDSTLDLHRPFVMATRDGQEIIADAQHYDLRKEDVQALQTDGIEFGRILRSAPEIVAPEAAQFIQDAVAEAGRGDHPERTVTYSSSTIANFTIVAAEIAGLALLGSMVGGTAILLGLLGSSAGAAGTLTGAAGAIAALRKRQRTKEAIAFAKMALADLENGIHRGLTEILQYAGDRHAKFMLKHEILLRRLASRIRILGWLGKYLDWLSDNSP